MERYGIGWMALVVLGACAAPVEGDGEAMILEMEDAVGTVTRATLAGELGEWEASEAPIVEYEAAASLEEIGLSLRDARGANLVVRLSKRVLRQGEGPVTYPTRTTTEIPEGPWILAGGCVGFGAPDCGFTAHEVTIAVERLEEGGHRVDLVASFETPDHGAQTVAAGFDLVFEDAP